LLYGDARVWTNQHVDAADSQIGSCLAYEPGNLAVAAANIQDLGILRNNLCQLLAQNASTTLGNTSLVNYFESFC